MKTNELITKLLARAQFSTADGHNVEDNINFIAAATIARLQKKLIKRTQLNLDMGVKLLECTAKEFKRAASAHIRPKSPVIPIR